MNELIEALGILGGYLEGYLYQYPTNCDHDLLRVLVDPALVSNEHKQRLSELGFEIDENLECFCSYKFGSN